jgi:hypothetical protein
MLVVHCTLRTQIRSESCPVLRRAAGFQMPTEGRRIQRPTIESEFFSSPNPPMAAVSWNSSLSNVPSSRLPRSDHTRSVEAKQLDEGIVDTLVAVRATSSTDVGFGGPPSELDPLFFSATGGGSLRRHKGHSCTSQLVRPNTVESIWTNVPLTGMADALFLIQGGERTARSAAGAAHDGADIRRQTNTKV